MTRYASLLLCLPFCVHAAHPLISDDVGTQGEGGWQLELNGDYARDRDAGTRQRVANATLTRGVADTVDVYLNATWLRAETADEAGAVLATQGAGDLSLGAKWRFYSADGAALALKPFATMPTGDHSRGLGNGLPYYGVSAIATYEHEAWTLIANAVGAYACGDAAAVLKRQWMLSAGIGHAFSDALQAVGEVVFASGTEPAADQHPALMTVGLIYRVAPTFDLDVGYRYGLNRAEVHHGFGAGLAWRW
ncbi:transporter [Niveibacterium sp.]|uniref:transporter n=1 Tax=Niveibacterium sp. TaxID=2017444 RepID=UPI0035B48572